MTVAAAGDTCGGEPGRAALRAALRTTTEYLARELACPGASAPDWSEFEWRVARAVVAMHGVSSLLAVRLRWPGPEGWRQFLESQHSHTLERHRRIEHLLQGIAQSARAEGVGLVGLKGVALHELGIYRPGERPMADVDLLVAPRDFERASGLLLAFGFSQSHATWKHRVFVADGHAAPATLGEHASNYLKIELHELVAETLPTRLTDITSVVLPRQMPPGVNAYPSKAALLAHLALHAAGALTFRLLRLLHLNDIARLAARMNDADWDDFLVCRAQDGTRWWGWAALRLTTLYYPDAVPGPVLAVLAAETPRLLRRAARRWVLSDVSLSNPRIAAFPGIAWSQSPAEMLGYAARRIRPGAEVLELRKVVAGTELAASHTDWAQLSQGSRVLRWLTRRPVRADTLFAVRASLAQSGR